MKICFVGTNFNKYPIIDEIIESMREEGEDVTLVNWFANQANEFECDGDLFVYVDIYPLRTDKPCCHIERGDTEDAIIEKINNLSNMVVSSIGEVHESTPEQQTEEKHAVITEEPIENTIVIEPAFKIGPLRIAGFKFIIDGKEVELSKEDTDYLIKVFDTAKDNGYLLEKVIIDEETSIEQ